MSLPGRDGDREARRVLDYQSSERQAKEKEPKPVGIIGQVIGESIVYFVIVPAATVTCLVVSSWVKGC